MSDLRPRPFSKSSGEDFNSDMPQNLMNGEVGDAPDYTEIDVHSSAKHFNSHRSSDNMNDTKKNDADDDDIDETHVPKIHILGRSFNKVVMVTHFNIFLYSCAFWVQNAVFPYLSKALGANPVVFGYLQTTFGLVQLAGGPLFGRFGDIFGSQLAMILAFVASALSYFLLAISTTIPLLFLSRLPSVFMHAMQGGQMIVTDVCSSKKRADALGKLGLSYGIGMVVGPMIGGLIAKFFSLEKAAIAACLLSVLSIFITYAYVPSVKKATRSETETDKNVFSIHKITQLLSAPGAMFLMLIKLATGIPIGIFQSMFSIVALETFQLPPEQNSYIMSYIGIMAMIVQGVGIGIVTKKFSEINILCWSAVILVISYLLLSYVTTIWQMCVVFVPLITGLTFQSVVTTSALTHTVSDTDTGAMLGLSMAVHSLIRSLSPTVGGYMLTEFGFQSFGYLGFVASSVATAVLFRKRAQESNGF